MSMGWKIYWVFFVATLAVYLTMVVWSLPFIAAEAGGLIPFDMRPGGYSFDEAKAFLAALSPGGVAFYEAVQHRFDTAYPAMLAIVLAVPLWHLLRSAHVVVRGIAVAFPVIGAVADYMENAAVSAMLATGSDGVTADAVATASRWTVIKSASTTVGMVLLLVLLIVAWMRRRRA